jgi:ATP-binding cassette, subfamily B, bacterial HlyB/CyaB
MEVEVRAEASGAEASDTGLACLVIIARIHGIPVDPAQILHEFGEPSRSFDTDLIRHASSKLGFKTKLVDAKLSRLTYLALPALAIDNDGSMYVIARVNDKKSSYRIRVTVTHSCCRTTILHSAGRAKSCCSPHGHPLQVS